MKVIQSLIVIALLLFVSTVICAQNNKNPNSLTIKLLGVDYYSPLNEELYNFDEFTLGVGVEYYYYLGNSFSLGLPIRLGKMDYPFSGILDFEDRFWASFDAMVKYGFSVPETKRILPALYVGTGYTYLDLEDTFQDWQGQVNIGLSVDIQLTNQVYLQTSSEYRFSQRDHWHNSMGIVYNFGKSKSPQVNLNMISKIENNHEINAVYKTEENEIQAMSRSLSTEMDTDNDGIADVIDLCPNERGVPEMSGCPMSDIDGDGLLDMEDKCPEHAGSFETAGCPDTDKDGIVDAHDKCVTLKGHWKDSGCPDTDKDGVIDMEDRCPKIPGSMENEGCPIIQKTTQQEIKMIARFIEFDQNSTRLTIAAYTELNEIIYLLNNTPSYGLSIEGHTDNLGDPMHNQTISEQRAKACYDYLLEKGIQPKRMIYNGFGQLKPRFANHTPQGRAKNRRVEFNLFIKP